MSSLLKKTNQSASFSEQAGLVGYSDKEILKAVEVSRAAVAAGRVRPAREAYARYKTGRNRQYAEVQSLSLRAR